RILDDARNAGVWALCLNRRASDKCCSRDRSEDDIPMAKHALSPPVAEIDSLAFRLATLYTRFRFSEPEVWRKTGEFPGAGQAPPPVLLALSFSPGRPRGKRRSRLSKSLTAAALPEVSVIPQGPGGMLRCALIQGVWRGERNRHVQISTGPHR